MGREVKRVALDFDWPTGKTWRGYVNPHYRKCPHCENGTTASREALSRIVSLLMIAGEDSLKRPDGFRPTGRSIEIPTYPGSPYKRLYPHPYLIEAGIADPGAEMHKLTAGLAGRGPDRPFGHDSCDRWSAERKIIEAAGLDPKTWGICPHCKGDAVDPAAKEAYETWQKEEPPAGDGWQMWETVSEGSPISPVFRTAEKLASWLADTGASAGGDSTATYEQWLAMIRKGWAPSMVGIPGKGLMTGVEASTEL